MVDDEILVQKREFDDIICSKLGLTPEQLRVMDIGDVEKYMEEHGFPLRYDPPHELYKVILKEEYERREKILNKIT